MNGCKEELTQSRTSSLTVLNLNYNGNDLDQIDNDSSGREVNSSDKIASENRDSNNKCEYSSCGKVASPVNIFQSTAKDGNVTDKFNKRYDILDFAENSRNRILENLANDSKQPEKGLFSGPSRGLSQTVVKVDNAMEEFKKGCDLADSATKEASKISLEISDTDSNDQKGFQSSSSRGLSGKTVIDNNATAKFNEKHDIAHPAKKEETRIYLEILDKDCVGCDKDILSGPSRGLKKTNMSDLTNICMKSDDISEKLNSKIRVYHHRRKTNSSAQNDAQLQEDESSLKVREAFSLKISLHGA